MPLVDIDYWAVVVATAATFALGALGYPPLRLPRGNGKRYFVAVLCHLVMALVLAVLMSLTGFGTWGQGLLLGFLGWLGFAAPLGLTATVFSDEPIGLWLRDTAYHLVTLLLMGAILGAWRQWG